MPASSFEFRHRFWLIGAFFWIGFSLYWWDHVNAGAAIGRWLSSHGHWPARIVIRLVFVFSALLALAAAMIRTWACSFLRSEVVHDKTLHAERLVAGGPYRYVRNPLYLGTVLLTLAMGLMASRAGLVFMVAGVLWFVLRLIGREEAELAASQGESYQSYRRAVPCLLPSLLPRVSAGGGKSQWKQAVLGEVSFWGLAAALVVFAITLKLPYFWVTLAIAFLLYFVSYAALKKQRQGGRGLATRN